MKTSSLRGHTSCPVGVGANAWEKSLLPGEVNISVRGAFLGVSKGVASRTSRSALSKASSSLEDHAKLSSKSKFPESFAGAGVFAASVFVMLVRVCGVGGAPRVVCFRGVVGFARGSGSERELLRTADSSRIFASSANSQKLQFPLCLGCWQV